MRESPRHSTGPSIKPNRITNRWLCHLLAHASCVFAGHTGRTPALPVFSLSASELHPNKETVLIILFPLYIYFYIPMVKSCMPRIKSVIIIIENPMIKILMLLFCIIFSLSDKKSSLLVFLCSLSVFLNLQSAMPTIVNPKRLPITNVYFIKFCIVILLQYFSVSFTVENQGYKNP